MPDHDLEQINKHMQTLEGWIAPGQIVGSTERFMTHGNLMVAKAILRLDRSSTRLAAINLWLAALVVVLMIVQIVIAIVKH